MHFSGDIKMGSGVGQSANGSFAMGQQQGLYFNHHQHQGTATGHQNYGNVQQKRPGIHLGGGIGQQNGTEGNINQ